MPGDSHSDTSRDTVSLTYQELADRLGIDVQSARRRVLRAGWAKLPGNDGKARVLVPATVLPTAGATTPATVAPSKLPPTATVPATPEALLHLLSQVVEMGDLRDRLGRMEAERDAARLAAANAETESATLREQVEAERARAAQVEREREAAKVAAAAAEGRAEGLRLALEEARRPFWRRWLDR